MITKLVREKIPLMLGLALIIEWAKEKIEGKDVKLELLIAFVAEEFKFDLEDYKEYSLNKLNNHIVTSGASNETIITSMKEDMILEITTLGIISIVQSWTELYFEGVSVSSTKTTILRINGQDYDSWNYTETEVKILCDDICILLEVHQIKKADARAKVGAIYDVFRTPRMSNPIKGYNILLSVVNTMQDYTDIPALEQRKLKEGYCDMIIDKYLQYLWTMNAEKKDTKYIQAFETFINRNKDAWARGLGSAEESLNLYMEGHKSVVETFRSLREPIIMYKCQGRKKDYKRDLPKEPMASGLGGM